MELKTDDHGRILSRTERIDGRRETWTFKYDGDGRLIACIGANGWSQNFEYDNKGRRNADYAIGRTPFLRVLTYDDNGRLLSTGDVTYTHDDNGFRSIRAEDKMTTRYNYARDGRLLGVELPDGVEISYEYDEDGLRSLKKVNGDPVTAYDWLDATRLSGFFDGKKEFTFKYAQGAHLPHAVHTGNAAYDLKYDQAGSPKIITTKAGDTVKAIQYAPSGRSCGIPTRTSNSPSGLQADLPTTAPAWCASVTEITIRKQADGHHPAQTGRAESSASLTR